MGVLPPKAQICFAVLLSLCIINTKEPLIKLKISFFLLPE